MPAASSEVDDVAGKEPGETKRLRVLVVDDDVDLRAMLHDTLSYLGCEVEEARDGREALGAIAKRRFDMVFTDLSMPRLSGVGLVAELADRAERPRIVLLTGEPKRASTPGLRFDAVEGWLEKPVRLDDLAALLEGLSRSL